MKEMPVDKRCIDAIPFSSFSLREVAVFPFADATPPSGAEVYVEATPPAFREETEILYVAKGTGKITVGDTLFQVTPGTMFVLPPHTLSVLLAETPLSAFSLLVSEALLRALAVPPHGHAFSPVISADPDAISHFLNFLRCQEQVSPLSRLHTHIALCELLLHLSKKHLRPRSRTALLPPAGVEAALLYIHTHLTERMTLKDLAGAAGMSRSRFAEVFRQTMKKTPVEYVNDLRCHHAKALLLSGRYSVSDACFFSGFDNLSYFSRTFHRYMGVSPSACKPEK